MKKPFVIFTTVALALALAQGASADPVTIPNFSFESPDYADGTSGPASDWNLSSFFSSASANDRAGAATPGGAGDQEALFAIGTIPSGFTVPFAALTSAGSILTIQASTTYLLTVAIALHTLGGPSGSYASVTMFAGGTPAASVTTTTNAAVFSDFTASFTTAASGDPRVGQPLAVQIQAGQNVGAFSTSAQVDNIRIDATVVPEPNAAMLLLAGAAFLGRRRTRH